MKYALLFTLMAAAPAFAAKSTTQTQMNLKTLREKAFALCQNKKFEAPVTKAIPALDPPREPGPTTEGMVYQEELSVRTSNLLDQNGFYFSPRPRAAVNTIPMKMFVETGSGTYKRKTWEDANVDYTSPNIVPAIDRNQIPDHGRVLTEIIIGHQSPAGDWPQLFDIRSSGYLRFAGYPPQITGASLRIAAHNIFGQGALNGGPELKEHFPIIREIYLKTKSSETAHAYLLVESELLCGAVSIDMNEGERANMVVDGHWYMRRDFDYKKEAHVSLVAYSSMFWKNEKQTVGWDSDEAHDSDHLHVEYADGSVESVELEVPEHGLMKREFNEAKSWLLSNDDKDPAHYADFAPALGSTNYPFRASYKVEILESNAKTSVNLYQFHPDGEYGDNIVASSNLRQSFRKAKNAGESIHFKYRTTAL